MKFAIHLARTNVVLKTGGPFGADVFESSSGQVVSVGMNLVASSNCSLAHAELVALAHAQQALGHFDLGATGIPALELVTSCEPCAMCYGAIPWSGIRKVICGARSQDAANIGFDEGTKPRNWIAALQRRGIRVRRDLCREEAVEVFRHYIQVGGTIYNARRRKG